MRPAEFCPAKPADKAGAAASYKVIYGLCLITHIFAPPLFSYPAQFAGLALD